MVKQWSVEALPRPVKHMIESFSLLLFNFELVGLKSENNFGIYVYVYKIQGSQKSKVGDTKKCPLSPTPWAGYAVHNSLCVQTATIFSLSLLGPKF